MSKASLRLGIAPSTLALKWAEHKGRDPASGREGQYSPWLAVGSVGTLVWWFYRGKSAILGVPEKATQPEIHIIGQTRLIPVGDQKSSANRVPQQVEQQPKRNSLNKRTCQFASRSRRLLYLGLVRKVLDPFGDLCKRCIGSHEGNHCGAMEHLLNSAFCGSTRVPNTKQPHMCGM